MAATARVGSLWRNRAFVAVWFGQTVSFLGSQVSGLALPLTATLLLDATPAQMGLLTFAGPAPYLLLSLVAGMWVDRMRRRPILIAADLVRAVLVGSIPLLYLVGGLRIEYVIGITFLLGACSVLFDLAYQSFLPSVIAQRDLMDGNSKLWTSRSAADVAGPGVAGILIQALTPPVALLIDALSFVTSALSLRRVGTSEAHPAPARRAVSARQEITDGLRFTFGDALLRAGALSAATYNFCANIMQAVLVLYVIKQLGLSAGAFGLTLTVGALGAFAGSVLTARAAKRFGVGPTTSGAAALCCGAHLLIPFIDSPQTALGLLAITFFVRGLGLTGWNVQIESLQQATVPGAMMGRMNASYLLLSQGAGSLGALLGGFLGTTIGLRSTLTVGAIGIAFAWLWLVWSPLRPLRALPTHRAE